ncbi:hypothetical protein G7054_g15168 [Neopestalotiopsis clavispora]|nr:hypothetical protein G7054_g15168 [Neopestalotiopsis clavispora]
MSTNVPEILRFGDRDYKIVPIPQDGGANRSELLRYDSKSLDDVDPYSYKPLPGGKKRIRLVQLLSGGMENQVSPAMRVTENEAEKKEIEYEALSWCWGVDEPMYAVRIEDGEVTFKIKVKRELALALKHLRHPHKARTLWIDAICMNQNDPDERNHQVQMMSRIYTRADQVCVWLGEDIPESKLAIDFIKDEIMELKNFDTICSDKQYTHKWQALMMLMQAVWFSRRWVIQEIALARQATVYCGTQSISWKDFAIAVELFVEVETATHRLSEVMQKDEKFRHVPGWFEYVSELGASLLVQATGKVFRVQKTPAPDSESTKKSQGQEEARSIVQTIDPLERRSLLSLEFLVSSMFIFNATEPRDAVYALLGIARDAAPFVETSYDEDDPSSLTMTLFDKFLEEKPFPIDYTRPYSDVCRDFVRFVIRRKSKLDPIQALDILCRPWALAQPKTKSKAIAQIDTDTSEVSPEKKPTKAKTWRTRKCDVEYKKVNGRDKWKLIKTADDKWEDDKRSTKAYIEYIQGNKEWESPAGAPSWQPPKGWNDYKQWCDTIRGERDARIKAQAEAKAQEATEAKNKKKGKKIQTKNVETVEEDDLKLPSWVAQASRAPFTLDHHPGMRFLKTGRANADPLVGPPSDGHRNYSAAQTRKLDLNTLKFRKRPCLGHHSMYVKGFELDEVVTVEDASQGGNIPVSWLKLGGWEKKDEAFPDDPPDELWRTLVADRGRDNRNPPYYYARACRESVHKGSVSSGRVATAELINNERNSIVAEFCRRVHAVIWNRRMFKTKGVPVILKIHEKESDDREKEKIEDKMVALTACIRQCGMNYRRKCNGRERFEKNKERWTNSGEWEAMMEAKRLTEIELAKDAAEREKNVQAESVNHGTNDDSAAQRSDVSAGGEPISDQAPHQGPQAEGEPSSNASQPAASPTGEKAEGGPSGDNPQPAVGPSGEEVSGIDNGTGNSPNSPAASSAEPPQSSELQSQGDSTNEEKKPNTYQEKVKEAKEEDPNRWHTFQGDCYLHGMMDGEAVREKFYQEIPDRIFELR